jgi:hypothetical protein
MALESVKPMASLSAGLLARKGGARPGQKYMAEAGLEIPERNCVIRFGGGESYVAAAAPEFHEPFADNDLPIVMSEAEVVDLRTSVAAPEFKPAPVFATSVLVAPKVIEPKQRRAAGSGPKAAFTLRLDAERHLRLRLLSAHQHRSAQRIVLEAVDRLLAETFEPLLASGRLIAAAANEQVA